MSTICLKDNIMAADTQMSSGDMLSSLDFCKLKIHQHDGIRYAMAFCGDVADMDVFYTWFIHEGYEMNLDSETPVLEEDFRAIVYKNDTSEVYFYSSRCIPTKMSQPISIGSGCEFAMGAMAHGASASESVSAAKKLCLYTGGHTDVIYLNDENFLVQRIEGYN